MRNSTLRRVVQVLGVISAMAFLPVAHAVQVTLTVPDCPSGQALAFDSSTNTLSCQGSTPTTTPGSCTITAVPPSSSGNGLTANTQVQLTASCTTGVTPITYSWSIGVIGAVVTVAPGTTTTYTVTPSNSSGPGAAVSNTVYIGTQSGGTAPGNCGIAQSPNTLASPVNAGTTVTLTATCGSGSPVTACAWSNGATGCSISVVAPSANTSYSVIASNTYGPAPSTSTTIQVNGTSGTGQNFCTGSDLIINVPWPASGQVRPSTNGFGNQKLAFKITVPFTFSPPLNINHIGFMRIVEVPGAAVTTRDFTISKNSCDFQSGDYLINGIGFGDTSPGANFAVNNPNGFAAAGAQFNIQSGDTVYVNVRNANNGFPSCPNATCDVLFDFATPNRY